jgi:hypothetical protein
MLIDIDAVRSGIAFAAPSAVTYPQAQFSGLAVIGTGRGATPIGDGASVRRCAASCNSTTSCAEDAAMERRMEKGVLALFGLTQAAQYVCS